MIKHSARAAFFNRDRCTRPHENSSIPDKHTAHLNLLSASKSFIWLVKEFHDSRHEVLVMRRPPVSRVHAAHKAHSLPVTSSRTSNVFVLVRLPFHCRMIRQYNLQILAENNVSPFAGNQAETQSG